MNKEIVIAIIVISTILVSGCSDKDSWCNDCKKSCDYNINNICIDVCHIDCPRRESVILIEHLKLDNQTEVKP